MTNDVNGLVYAAKVKNLANVKHLVEQGVDINGKNYQGRTALMEAAGASGKGDAEIVKYLVDHNANVLIENPNDHQTALGYAVQKSLDLQAIASTHPHADPYALDPEAEMLAAQMGVSLSTGNDTGLSKNETDILKTLITHLGNQPVSVSVSHDDITAISLLVESNELKGYSHEMDMLLSDAVDRDEFETVKYLVFHQNANPNVRDANGETALMRAIDHGDDKMAKYLINYGVNLNDLTNGTTAVTRALDIGRDDMVRYIVEHGGSLGAGDDGHIIQAVSHAIDRHDNSILRYIYDNRGYVGTHDSVEGEIGWYLQPSTQR